MGIVTIVLTSHLQFCIHAFNVAFNVADSTVLAILEMILYIYKLNNGILGMLSHRNLSLQEYQSKQILSDYGITIQKFRVASNADEVEQLTTDLCKYPNHVVSWHCIASSILCI